MPLADKLAGYAECNLDKDHVRESAFAMAQAAVYYYRTLFYVYHGFEADSCDVLSETNIALPKQFCHIRAIRPRFLRRIGRVGAALRPRETVRRDSKAIMQ